MNLMQKRKILTAYFMSHGGFPHGCVRVADPESTVCNVFINGTYYGVFNFEKRDFIKGSVDDYVC